MNRLLFIACLFVVSNQAFSQNGSCEKIDGALEIKQEFNENSGCWDEKACNYDPETKYANNSLCNYDCYGCMDEEACNFNSKASEDDDSCYYPEQTWLNCDGCCNNDSDKDGICDEEEDRTRLDLEEWVSNGNHPDNFQCAFEPKCLDECGVAYGNNSSCTDACGVINGDGSSCIEPEEESAIVKLFREGGTGFMMCVLICLILGLAICIERIIYLMMASSNSSLLYAIPPPLPPSVKEGLIIHGKPISSRAL